MTHDVSAPGDDDREVGERARGEFLEFLGGARPGMFVADSLAWLLRTEPPVNVTHQETADLIALWAEDRARATVQPVSVVMLNAIQRILDLNRASALDNFDPEAFFDTVVAELANHCPATETSGFRSGLRDLRAWLHPRPVTVPESATTADSVELHGKRVSIRDAQEMTISRLEHGAYMTDADFAEALSDLEIAMTSRVGIPIHTALSRIARAAAKIFNTGRVRQAEQLFGLAEQCLDRLSISREGRIEIRNAVVESDLNEGLLAKVLSDPDNRGAVRPLLRMVGYLTPAEALVTLAIENRRDRRRLLLAAIETVGSDAYPIVLDNLTASMVGNPTWFATRNYLYLLSRLDPPDEVSRRRAIDLTGKFVTHDLPQLRTAAIAALRHIGGRDVIPYIVRVLDANAYAPGSIDDTDSLKRHLYQAFETIVETGNEAAIAIVAEFATGTRGADFDLGQTLRDEACAALTHNKGPLPRRAAIVIANYLGNMVNRKFKLVTGKLAFGLDTHACRMLSTLIRDSAEPEAREILEHPVLAKILSRGTGELA